MICLHSVLSVASALHLLTPRESLQVLQSSLPNSSPSPLTCLSKFFSLPVCPLSFRCVNLSLFKWIGPMLLLKSHLINENTLPPHVQSQPKCNTLKRTLILPQILTEPMVHLKFMSDNS